MFDAQAWYLRDVILGSKKLPSRDEMAEHSQQTDYSLLPEMIEEQEQQFRDWDHHKNREIMAYRDHGEAVPDILAPGF
ncbi:hypothetical protein AXG93_1757s1000 [Marchantia polymorpha subsp. ruderalis]|uniref:Uncharacterized protein n=1 Tax=Marchantia polymorpha subsp. ruderalis TaxID=1480154 RepID=A0A176WNV8_MARPO|nr:hypothetical protein AXG93_1757s1000 [Marchantia polymorpha subsp. ruderalis]